LGGVNQELIEVIRRGLATTGDPARAVTQQAYMKSAMPYAGVTVPEMRRLTRAAASNHPFDSTEQWRATILGLWRAATVREERYAATELIGLRPWRAAAQSIDALPMYEEFIVDGAWWDHVDEVAIQRIGPLLLTEPEVMQATMRAWSVDTDRWRRRSSVICQVGLGDRVDVDLLTTCIVANLDDREFFLRKAIGWALRQHARLEPEWVRSFVATHDRRLSPLSKREALRHLGGWTDAARSGRASHPGPGIPVSESPASD
jgi:3-methyladenine DNA glycosylase AlkD